MTYRGCPSSCAGGWLRSGWMEYRCGRHNPNEGREKRGVTLMRGVVNEGV